MVVVQEDLEIPLLDLLQVLQFKDMLEALFLQDMAVEEAAVQEP